MGIIDCHSHALPNLEQYADQLPPVIRDMVQDKVPAVQEFAQNLLGKIPVSLPQIPVQPKNLANLRKEGVGTFLKGVEYFSSLGVAPQTLIHGTVHNLLASMDRNDIQRSVVIAAPPAASNDWLLQITARHPDRLIPVCHTPKLPAESGPLARRKAFETMAQPGAKGFKIHPNVSPYPPDHIAYETLFETARRHDLFVIIHTGCFNIPGYSTQRPAEPGLFTPLFERYREVRVCLAHMNRDNPERAWDIMQRYDNVYADTSWQTSGSIAAAIAATGNERIVLGSDWPLLNDDLQTTNLEALRQGTSDADFEQITDTNARRLIGLP